MTKVEVHFDVAPMRDGRLINLDNGEAVTDYKIRRRVVTHNLSKDGRVLHSSRQDQVTWEHIIPVHEAASMVREIVSWMAYSIPQPT